MKTLLLVLLFASSAGAREITTNSIRFTDAPDWLTERQLQTTTRRVENFLEWDIRRIRVFWHRSPATFQAAHQLNFNADAFFRKGDASIHLGPSVNADNFEKIFGHELVHAIFFQKYKGAIPTWLEEGLANYIGKTSSPDYAWLAAQPRRDVTQLMHPGKDASGSRYHYQTSTALIEMIVANPKCSLRDLLQLSVGKKMATYLATYCEIRDLNQAFNDWIAKKAK